MKYRYTVHFGVKSEYGLRTVAIEADQCEIDGDKLRFFDSEGNEVAVFSEYSYFTKKPITH